MLEEKLVQSQKIEAIGAAEINLEQSRSGRLVSPKHLPKAAKSNGDPPPGS
jgi:hypothetical protein